MSKLTLPVILAFSLASASFAESETMNQSRITATVNTTVTSTAAAGVSAPTPKSLSQPKWYHWLYKVLADDTDRSLQKNGLFAKACTVITDLPAITKSSKAESSYAGVAPCLVDLFLASMKTDQPAGKITAWFAIEGDRLVQAEIFWRPEPGGWIRQIKTILNLQFEDTLYWTQNLFAMKPNLQQVDPKENLIGSLHVQFANDPEGLRSLFLALNPPLRLRDTPQSVSLNMKAVGRKNGYLEYDLQLTMGYQNPMRALTMIHAKTNINLTRMRRRFQISGQQIGTRSIERDEIR